MDWRILGEGTLGLPSSLPDLCRLNPIPQGCWVLSQYRLETWRFSPCGQLCPTQVNLVQQRPGGLSLCPGSGPPTHSERQDRSRDTARVPGGCQTGVWMDFQPARRPPLLPGSQGVCRHHLLAVKSDPPARPA